MAFLQFVTLLEREFDIVIETEDIDETNFKTLNSTVRYVNGKLSPSETAQN